MKSQEVQSNFNSKMLNFNTSFTKYLKVLQHAQKNHYSQLSPYGHLAITDTPLLIKDTL